MEKGFLSYIAEAFLDKLTSLAGQEIENCFSFKDDLERLEDTISTIKCVLLDAEEQQSKSLAVKDWLEKLKDAFYDTQDLFDDLSVEALSSQLDHKWSIVTKVRNFFLNREFGSRVKDMKKRLDVIAEERMKFHFRDQVGSHMNTKRKESYSFVRISEVVGRENDREAIIRLLMGDSEEGLHVIPVVGMGGLGKTTLAQLVYNDDRVKGYFDLRMWVCVSDDFNVKELVQRITRAATGANCDNLDMNNLNNRLLETLDGRRFLLVLDDIWCENRVEWVKLRDLLINGARGSRIVLTTRNRNVASMMGTVNSYQLAGLSEDDCWSLFGKWVFKEGESTLHPKLVKIGKEIVRKCEGVPLAIITLGGVLYLKREEDFWLFVKDNEIWKMAQRENDILPVLRLSYDQMPSYLKQCFVYCSLLPKGQVLDKETLIQLWMAQGFIQSTNWNQELEDVGGWYFNDLLSRSFFEIVHENDRGEVQKCRMHDLIHDLSKLVAGVEFIAVNSGTNNISKRIRHVSFHCHWGIEDARPLLQASKLRTLFLPFKVGNSQDSFQDILISSFSYLHVLDLSSQRIKDLPSSIGDLKHLRYLNLSGNYGITYLPASICKMRNLQTLKLLGCVQISNLPSEFGNLVSLRHLVVNTPKLSSWEKQIGGLTSLRSLRILHCDNLVSLSEEMWYLTALRTLCIHNCAKLASLPSSTTNLTALENLEIVNCPKLCLSGMCIQGLSKLKTLALRGLPKLLALPQGIEHCSNALEYLSIKDCHNLMTLPEGLRSLTSLTRLYITCCPNLLYLPEGLHHMTALQVLQIDECPHLNTRCQREIGEDWHKIAHVPDIYVDKLKM